MSLADIARSLQFLDGLLPLRFRLPLRYRTQALLGALEAEVALLPSLLRDVKGQTAIDVGANIGIYTYALVRNGMTVHAFEPQVDCCRVIAAWSAGRDGVHVHNVGVGAADGELVLRTPVARGRAVSTRASFQHVGCADIETRVAVTTLDSAGLSDVGFVKIDVEGFELSVLRGATALLGEHAPILLIEIDRERHTQQSFGEIVNLLMSLSYKMSYVEDGRLVDCTDDPWFSPSWVYNFVLSADEASGSASGPPSD